MKKGKKRKPCSAILNKTHSQNSLNTDKLISFFETIDQPIYIADPDTYELLYVNDAVKKTIGNVLGKKCYKALQGREKPCEFCTNKFIFGKNNNKRYIWQWQNSIDKKWYRCIDKAIPWNKGKLARFEIAIDINELKNKEMELAESENKYRHIVEDSMDGICMIKKGKIEYVNNSLCRILNFKKKELIGKEFLDIVHVDEKELIKERINRKLRGQNTINHYVFTGIKKNGDMPSLEISCSMFNFNKEPTIMFFIRDITQHVKAEERLKISLEQSKRIIDGTIKAMAKTVEMRDPYTAGHQRRVARLAYLIAKRMKLNSDKSEGVLVAGTLHDIGKIYVPSEILAKPGKLNITEMNLIKEHSRIGYEILKAEEFPWPIAKIVHQHHERMNGSGYPSGLRGNDILVEARILAVADSVEAMASHRPYRPALGITKALKEIVNLKNTLYDAEVVDVCVNIFAQRKYSPMRGTAAAL